MKKTKWVIIFFLIISMSILIISCDKKSKNNQTNDESVTLRTYGRYWVGMKLGMEEFFIPNFKEETGIGIELRHFNKSEETLLAVKMDTEAGKETADFLWIDLMDLPAYKANDLLMDISDLVEPYKDKLPQTYLDAVTTKDSAIIAIPHHISADFMMYNSNEVTEENLPDSYEELLVWAKENPGKYSYRGKDEGLSTSLMNFLYAFEALTPEKDPSRLFDTEYNPEIAEVFTYLQELYPYVHQPLYENNPVFEVDMANGTISLFANWDAELAKVRVDKNADYVKLHPNVQLEGKGGKRPICSGGWCFGIPKNAAHPEKAKEFIKYMMTIENQVLAIMNQQTELTYTGHIPIRSDAISEIPSTMARELFDVSDLDYLVENTFKNLVDRPNVPYYHDLSNLLQDVHQAIVINGEDVEKALARAQKDLDTYTKSMAESTEPAKE